MRIENVLFTNTFDRILNLSICPFRLNWFGFINDKNPISCELMCFSFFIGGLKPLWRVWKRQNCKSIWMFLFNATHFLCIRFERHYLYSLLFLFIRFLSFVKKTVPIFFHVLIKVKEFWWRIKKEKQHTHMHHIHIISQRTQVVFQPYSYTHTHTLAVFDRFGLYFCRCFFGRFGLFVGVSFFPESLNLVVVNI